MIATMRSQSAVSSKVMTRPNPGTPARCTRTWRVVIAALPFCANSGQYVATGSSRSIRPRSQSMRIAIVVTTFDVDATRTNVSDSHGLV